MPDNTLDLLKSWNHVGGTVRQKSGGGLFLLVYGGLFGREGTIDVLKTRVTPY